jgi:hypothetical protein
MYENTENIRKYLIIVFGNAIVFGQTLQILYPVDEKVGIKVDNSGTVITTL